MSCGRQEQRGTSERTWCDHDSKLSKVLCAFYDAEEHGNGPMWTFQERVVFHPAFMFVADPAPRAGTLRARP
jgi:hypothetical protein